MPATPSSPEATNDPDPATSAYQQLRGHLHYLRLEAAAEALPAALDHAKAQQLGHTAFLEHLLAIEVHATQARRQQSRLRFAAFPAPWRLEDFDFDAQPGIDRALVQELATLRFVEEHANVLLIGPPGVGKTHCETAAGDHGACRRASLDGGS